ncbi:MAG TPA: hypothetical protein VGU67_04660 [Edaphobacter sp.]|nr:hypothetical protein [Edaphobacter sp.]
MKRFHPMFLRSLALLSIFVFSSFLSNSAGAQSTAAAASNPAAAKAQAANAQAQARAVAAYNAYNAAFLVQVDGQAYYADTLTSVGIQPQAEWGGALAITVAEDAYEHTHTQADRNLVISLLNNLAYYNGPNSLFQLPGPLKTECAVFDSKLPTIRLHSTRFFSREISKSVRHICALPCAHSQGRSLPHEHKQKIMGRPVFFIACAMRSYTPFPVCSSTRLQ